jgi:ABC-type maltose transport system permease subunit
MEITAAIIISIPLWVMFFLLDKTIKEENKDK